MEFLPLIIVIFAVILIKRKISKSNFKFLETFKAQQKTKRSQMDYETQAIEDFMQDFENEDPDAILLAYVTAAKMSSLQDPAMKEMRDKYPFLKEQFAETAEETNTVEKSATADSAFVQQKNFCNQCGQKLTNEAKFCSGCGATV